MSWKISNLREDGTFLFAQLTTFTMDASLQILMDSFKRNLDFDPANNSFNITTIITKLNHLFVLATTGQSILGDPERIQHTLTAYACIKQPEEWAQWVCLQIDRFEEGIIPNDQSLMNSAALKYVKISANGSGSFGGSSTTISEDIVSMMDAVSKKRTASPTSKKNIATTHEDGTRLLHCSPTSLWLRPYSYPCILSNGYLSLILPTMPSTSLPSKPS